MDRERMRIKVNQGKGKKDRYVKLSYMLLPYLDKYPEEFIPKEYFFEWEAGKEYSESSVQNIAHAAEKAAGRKKKTSLHILRHTYATHSLGNGVDLKWI